MNVLATLVNTPTNSEQRVTPPLFQVGLIKFHGMKKILILFILTLFTFVILLFIFPDTSLLEGSVSYLMLVGMFIAIYGIIKTIKEIINHRAK